MRRQILAILLLGLAGSASGKTSLSAQQILAKAAENYRGVTGYAISGSVSTHMVVNDRSQDIANDLLVAYGGPGRSRFEAMTPSDRMLFVNSADSTLTYSSAFGQYAVMARSAATAIGGMPAVDPNAPHPFAGYARLADHVTAATLVREDTATVDGKTIQVFVIDVSYDSTVVPPQVVSKPKRLTIDQKTFLVVGDETGLLRSHPALEQPIQIDQRARFTSIRWNVAPPDSLFAFAAPSGAARVAQIGADSGPQEEEQSSLTGQPADDFTLPDLTGVKRMLSSHKGKVVLLDFWATWCGPCRREMPIIAKLHQRFAQKGLVVYGVNCSETQAKARAFVEKYKYDFPQLLDMDGSVQTRYQVTAIPTVFIVDKEGTIRAHLVGGRSEEELVAALERAGLDTGP